MKSVIQIPLALPPWQVIQPPVVRYLESKYVDEFLKHGNLRISTCARFSKHADEQREDQHEGMIRASARFGEGTFDGLVSVASNAIILSACCVEDMSEGARFHSAYDAAFRITDTIQFAAAVARALPGYRGGFQGFCIYRDSKHIDISDIAPQLGMGSPPPQSEAEARLFFDHFRSTLSARVTHDAMLRKPLKYRSQNEYRFVWVTESSSGNDFIDLCVPDAIQFCERVERGASGVDMTANMQNGIQITMMSEKEAKAYIDADKKKELLGL